MCDYLHIGILFELKMVYCIVHVHIIGICCSLMVHVVIKTASRMQ